MLTAWLQQGSAWRFDPLSALIGAIIAWLIAAIIYVQRHAIKRTAQKLWEPLAEWRRRMRASVEEKYLRGLQQTLIPKLLFAPDDPTAVFAPPTFLAPAPLPDAASADGALPYPLTVAFSNLQEGHTRLLLTGAQASGRTTALILSVWETAQRGATAEKPAPFDRFPLWADLAHYQEVPTEGPSPLERLAYLAAKSLPEAIPKWLLEQLNARPSLILVDNWEVIPPAQRPEVAAWIDKVAEALPKSLWIISSTPEGYGPLVEHGFVPLEIVPPIGEEVAERLYQGWRSLLAPQTATEEESTAEQAAEEAALLKLLKQMAESGAPSLEITLRSVLYLRSHKAPTRFEDVLAAYLDEWIPMPDLGDDQFEVAAQAKSLAIKALQQLAYHRRIEGASLNAQVLEEQIQSLLPPEEEERPPKLEGAIKRLIQKSELLQRSGKELVFAHYVWENYLTATLLAKQGEEGIQQVMDHLHDPTWALLIECFAGQGDTMPLVKETLQTYQKTKSELALMQVVRWAALAPKKVVWRKVLMKILAQEFTEPQASLEKRVRIGRALLLTTGDNARLFYLQALRHPAPPVRAAALRGLGWTGTPQEMHLLRDALNDESAEIRYNAVEALSDLGTPGAVRVLQQTFFHADEQQMLLIAKSLAGYKSGWETLKQAAEHENLLVRRAAAHGLGNINRPWAKELLRRMALEDSQWVVRSSAEAALSVQAEGPQEQVFVPTPPEIDQISWLVAWAAKQGLGLGVGEAAMQTLLEALGKGDTASQILGAQTLAYMGTLEHVRALIPLARSEDPAVKQAATVAIHWIRQRYKGLEELES